MQNKYQLLNKNNEVISTVSSEKIPYNMMGVILNGEEVVKIKLEVEKTEESCNHCKSCSHKENDEKDWDEDEIDDMDEDDFEEEDWDEEEWDDEEEDNYEEEEGKEEDLTQGQRFLKAFLAVPQNLNADRYAILVDSAWRSPVTRNLIVNQINTQLDLAVYGNNWIPKENADRFKNVFNKYYGDLEKTDGVTIFAIAKEFGIFSGLHFDESGLVQLLAAMKVEVNPATKEEIANGLAILEKVREEKRN